MSEITQMKVEFMDFFIPLVAINICLFISQNPKLLEGTLFKVDYIG